MFCGPKKLPHSIRTNAAGKIGRCVKSGTIVKVPQFVQSDVFDVTVTGGRIMAVSAAIRGVLAGLLFACCALSVNYGLFAADARSDGKDQPGPDARAETIQTPVPEASEDGPALPPAPECGMGCYGGGPCGYGDDGACWGGWCLCGPPGQFWLHADYMVWWTKGAHLPPLVTTSPPGTPPDQAGVLGADHTSILFGDSLVNGGSRSGFRVAGGGWLNPCRTCALQGDYFDSGLRSTDFFSGRSNGDPILARPFFNAETGQSAAAPVAVADFFAGSIAVHADDYFQSAGATLRAKLLCRQPYWYDPCGHCGFRLDLLGGYRYYRFSDGLVIHENFETLVPLTTLPVVGTTLDIVDSFRTRNDFHGGELGLSAQLFRGRWSLEFLARVALGNNRQVAALEGSTVETVPQAGGPPQVASFSSGTFVVSGNGFNAGEHFRDSFAVVPNFQAQLGFQWSCHLRTYVGYDFLYWSGIARSGEEMDLTLNGTSPPHPTFQWHRTKLLAQGLSAGLEFRY